MEISTVIGFAAAFTAIILTILIEGGNLGSFVNISALTLIIGGSFAVGMISYGLKEMISIPKFILKTIFPPDLDFKTLIKTLVDYAEKSRREGLLSLEEEVFNIKDEMLNLGLGLVVDGTDPDYVREILEELSNSMNEHLKLEAEIFETIGGFSPTLGIIGTVMGLVHVLENLGSIMMETLGRGIAVAFIATFYGIGFANLIWLPAANKLKFINAQLKIRNQIVISGVMGIQAGNNPRIIMDKILCCIENPDLRAKIKQEISAE
jgi:chemotaxis protein MotA